ncbi:MAG: xylose isomerase [Roseibacillus sp.]|nr:xylose isomerase [Roseibacillus sp.]MBP34494.1 xylose isomerase [Roseibacillus sp.]MCP4731008.1 sugar phosphate isomerase/epimerase [Roseibacillus sp.]MDP7307647.1 sugar phosphate isomerase/epimerase [Roseibacillus sp.]MDP7654438.1 sugar phosphate isomerase/epimerase [Roseibacillus sp.]
MKIGCFALMEPFTPMRRQFEVIRELGFDYADLTDNHDGSTLGAEYGFAASFSLDEHPATIREMVAEFGLTLTSVCAHGNLLDPASPSRYGTMEIIKAIRLAHHLGVQQVITTEGDPKTGFAEGLSREEKLFSIREKLHEPVRWARELGIDLLLEPHGELTDTVEGMSAILEALGNEDVVGVNLDTGNSWLGGGEPMEFIKAFGPRIKHVHWKDMEEEWVPKRGTKFGCGMGMIPLGDGVVGIRAIVESLLESGFDGPTTLEVAGPENVRKSAERLREWSS